MKKLRSMLAILLSLLMIMTLAPSLAWAQGGGAEEYAGDSSKQISLEGSDSLQNTFSKAAPDPVLADSDVPVPVSSKNVVSNGDGTYTLSLSVTGKADTGQSVEATKSNVIIVMDRSNSMSNNSTWVTYTYDSDTYDPDRVYRDDDTNWGSTRVYYRNGAWRTSDSDTGTEYTGTVYTNMTRLDAEQYALDGVVKSLLSKNTTDVPDLIEITVTSYNLRSPGLNSSNTAISDVVDSTNYTNIMDAINNDGHHEATNWDEGLRHAKALADAWKTSEPGEQVYVVFLTDGEPTASYNDTTYTTGNTAYWRHWGNAETQAKAIVAAGHEFFSIFTYGTNNTYINYLNNLTRSANGVGTYTQENFGSANTYHGNFYNATDTSSLINAFNAIVDHITNALGLAGVSFQDGIATDVTHTALSTSVSGEVNGVTYTKTGGTTPAFTVKVGSDGTPVYTIGESTSNGATIQKTYDKIVEDEESGSITTTSATAEVYSADADNPTYLMPKATLVDGEVEWDLAPLGMLEDGATYTISFIVWPDQDAYDYVANLNNGISGYTWDASKQEPVYASDGTTVLYYKNGVASMPNIVKYPNGVFAALTNTHQNLDYYVCDETTHEDGTTVTTYTAGQPIALPAPEPMQLTTSGAKITKKWNSELQMVQLARYLYDTRNNVSKKVQIPFDVKQDGKDYKTVTLGWNDSANAYDWAETEAEMTTVTDNGNTFKLGTKWQEDFALATGIMLSKDRMDALGLDKSQYPSGTYDGKTYYLIETGHTYEVNEPPLGSYNYDMETMLYHPMLVDGALKNVTFTVNESDNTLSITDSKDMNDGIRIDNTLRGGINLNKEVLGVDDKPFATADKFEFTIVLENSSGIFVGEDIPWFSVNGNYYHDDDGNYISEQDAKDKYGEPGYQNYGNVLEADDSGKKASAKVSITKADSVRIANVPLGTTYTITETANDAYELTKIDRVVQNADASEQVSDTITKPTDGKIVGEIVPNRENNITYTNKCKPVFYVYHSSDKTIERIAMTDKRVVAENDKYKFKIAYETKDGSIYGGYYLADENSGKGYNDQGMTDSEIIAAAYSSQENGKYTYNIDTHPRTKEGFWTTDEKGTPYTGENKTASWNADNAQSAEAGSEGITVSANKVYYLKEVPKKYLNAKTFTYYNKTSKALQKMYMESILDDANYSKAGFDVTIAAEAQGDNYAKSVVGDASGQTVYKSFQISNLKEKKLDETKYEYEYDPVNPTTLDVEKAYGLTNYFVNNYIYVANLFNSAAECEAVAEKIVDYIPYWITPDNVKVTSITDRKLTFDKTSTFTGVTFETFDTNASTIKAATASGTGQAFHQMKVADTIALGQDEIDQVLFDQNEELGYVAMHRMYNPNSGEHFYTGSTQEKDDLIAAGWNYEDIAWYAPLESDTPVYRLYNPNAGDHHYTVDAAERDALADAGWIYEGIGWYSADAQDAQSVPLYRVYNPNAYLVEGGSGAHHYTVSVEEFTGLVALGWQDEGVAWYGMEVN